MPVKPSTVARAECDAQRIGSKTGAPARAKQDIPPAIRRFVWRRDHGRCQVPGCRAARFLEIHHIRALADGGTHDPSGLILICDGCHTAIHEGTLTLTGTAPDALVFTRPNMLRAQAPATSNLPRSKMPLPLPMNEQSPATPPSATPPSATASRQDPVAPSSRFDRAVRREQLKQILMTSGFKRHEAAKAADEALGAAGHDASLDACVREAFRACSAFVGSP